MSNELQTKLDAILLDKNTNLLPENLKAGVTCLGIEGNVTFESFDEYNDCLTLSESVLNRDTAALYGEYLNFDGTFRIPLSIAFNTGYRYVIKFAATGAKNYEQFVGKSSGYYGYLARSGNLATFLTRDMSVDNTTIPTQPEERTFYSSSSGGTIVIGPCDSDAHWTCPLMNFYYLHIYDGSGNLIHEIVPANAELFGEKTLLDVTTGTVYSMVEGG